MSDATSDSEASASDDSNYSDHDTPTNEPISSTERSFKRSGVPSLAIGGAAASTGLKQRRPAVPTLSGLRLPIAPSNQDLLPTQQSSPQTLTAGPLNKPGSQGIAADDSCVAETEHLQPVRLTSRNNSSRSLGRPVSQRRSGRYAAPPQFRIQLASEAFDIHQDALDQPECQQLTQLDAVRQLCSSRLGLRADALRLYELHEVQSTADSTDGCSQLAIAVQDSGEVVAGSVKQTAESEHVTSSVVLQGSH